MWLDYNYIIFYLTLVFGRIWMQIGSVFLRCRLPFVVGVGFYFFPRLPPTRRLKDCFALLPYRWLDRSRNDLPNGCATCTGHSHLSNNYRILPQCQVRTLLARFLASLQLHSRMHQITLVSTLSMAGNIPDIADFLLFQNVATIAATHFRLDHIWVPVTFCHVTILSSAG